MTRYEINQEKKKTRLSNMKSYLDIISETKRVRALLLDSVCDLLIEKHEDFNKKIIELSDWTVLNRYSRQFVYDYNVNISNNPKLLFSATRIIQQSANEYNTTLKKKIESSLSYINRIENSIDGLSMDEISVQNELRSLRDQIEDGYGPYRKNFAQLVLRMGSYMNMKDFFLDLSDRYLGRIRKTMPHITRCIIEEVERNGIRIMKISLYD